MSRLLELIGLQRPEQPVVMTGRRRIAVIATFVAVVVVVVIIKVAVS